SGKSAAPDKDADVCPDFTGVKSICACALGIVWSTTSCQSAQPVGSGSFSSILPGDLPFFREASSYVIAPSSAINKVRWFGVSSPGAGIVGGPPVVVGV